MHLNLKVWCRAWNLSFVMIRASLNLKICQTVSKMWFIYQFIGHRNPNVWLNIPHFYLLEISNPQISLFSITSTFQPNIQDHVTPWLIYYVEVIAKLQDTPRNRHSGPEYWIFGCRKVQKSLFSDVGKLWTVGGFQSYLTKQTSCYWQSPLEA